MIWSFDNSEKKGMKEDMEKEISKGMETGNGERNYGWLRNMRQIGLHACPGLAGN
jgi:hypothetical protein